MYISAISSVLPQKQDTLVKTKQEDKVDKVNQVVDGTKKKHCEKNEADRKAAKEYMRMKKTQWKEQQAKEQDKKRMALEAKQLKLQQLQQTQAKLLKQSIKKKVSPVEVCFFLCSVIILCFYFGF